MSSQEQLPVELGRTRKTPARNRIPVYHTNLMSLPVQFV